MKALFDWTFWDASPVPSRPAWAKRGAGDELLVLLDASLSLNCVYFRASTHTMTWILKFARVRTDDRERNFRDSPVPQPVVQQKCEGPVL